MSVEYLRREMLACALHYASLGLEVFAIGSKVPYAAEWPFCDSERRGGFYAATTDEPTLAAMFERNLDAGLAMRPPSGYAVLDLDTDDPQGLPGKLGQTLACRTPRGWHIWYRWPYDPRPAVGIVRHGDLRPHDSYVRVPPTGGYEWVGGFDIGRIAEVPDWLRVLRPDNTVVTRSELLQAAGGLVGRVTDMLADELTAVHGNGQEYTRAEVQEIVDALMLRDLSRKMPRLVE